MRKRFGKNKIEQRHAQLEQKKDLLVRLSEVIEWEAFRASLASVHEKPRKSKVGRKKHAGEMGDLGRRIVVDKCDRCNSKKLTSPVNRSHG